MTVQEAKDMLQAKLTCFELDTDIEGCDCDCTNCEYNYKQGTIREQIEVLKMAIEALEKQIPKKPKTEPFYGGRCIVCNALIPNKSINYCHECGQKLDWGD